MPSNHLTLCHPPLLLPSIFSASGSFQMSQLFESGGQSIGVSASTSVVTMNTQDLAPLGWIGWISAVQGTLKSLLQHHSSKASILLCSAMPANMENSAVTTGQEKVSFHSNPKEGQCHRIFILGKIESRRRRGWQRTRWFNDICDSMDMSLSKLREMVKDREAWRATGHGVTRSQTWLSNWRTKIKLAQARFGPSSRVFSSRKGIFFLSLHILWSA